MTAHLLRGDARLPLAEQLRAALLLTVNKRGHLDSCGHRTWINGYTNQPGQRHACDLADCDGEGSPCTKKCLTVRAALALEGA